jgi:hypothetical protein
VHNHLIVSILVFVHLCWIVEEGIFLIKAAVFQLLDYLSGKSINEKCYVHANIFMHCLWTFWFNVHGEWNQENNLIKKITALIFIFL